jgi:CheY-like chemotaxis protein
MVSADASQGQARRFESMGASVYLTKPFDIRRFLELLDETLAQG